MFLISCFDRVLPEETSGRYWNSQYTQTHRQTQTHKHTNTHVTPPNNKQQTYLYMNNYLHTHACMHALTHYQRSMKHLLWDEAGHWLGTIAFPDGRAPTSTHSITHSLQQHNQPFWVLTFLRHIVARTCLLTHNSYSLDPSLEPSLWRDTVDKEVTRALTQKDLKRQELIYGRVCTQSYRLFLIHTCSTHVVINEFVFRIDTNGESAL